MTNPAHWTIEDATRYLLSADPTMRWHAVDQLQALGPWDFLRECGKCVSDPDWRVRGLTLHYYFDVLMDHHVSERELGQELRNWIDLIAPTVAPLVNDPMSPVAFSAVSVLELTAPYSDCGLDEVINALSDTRPRFLADLAQAWPEDNVSVQWAAANAMGEFGARAAPALARLGELCDSPDERTRIVAAESIKKIEDAIEMAG